MDAIQQQNSLLNWFCRDSSLVTSLYRWL